MAKRRAADIENALREILQRRANGQLSAIELYRELLGLLQDITEALMAEAEDDMSDEAIREQLPLILTVLREQIENLKDREG
ncbi:MAG: hypothetical protein GXO29_07420 [Thermotogae bacterium]|nr:hypothetical protein [Thermotogota bacterium]